MIMILQGALIAERLSCPSAQWQLEAPRSAESRELMQIINIIIMVRAQSPVPLLLGCYYRTSDSYLFH
jgi:hypothetical protein